MLRLGRSGRFGVPYGGGRCALAASQSNGIEWDIDAVAAGDWWKPMDGRGRFDLGVKDRPLAGEAGESG